MVVARFRKLGVLTQISIHNIKMYLFKHVKLCSCDPNSIELSVIHGQHILENASHYCNVKIGSPFPLMFLYSFLLTILFHIYVKVMVIFRQNTTL
jgi:hypothetical protein